MERIAAASQGFVYLVSVTGVTGARAEVSARVQQLVSDIKGKTELPVCVGFGVSNGAQAAQLKGWRAHGVIVGSALVKLLGQSESASEGLSNMKALAEELRKSLD
jgi:tryptophan synthase alpha chain